MTTKFIKIDNLELDQAVFDRMVVRCNELGCTVDDFIEQALTYAMDNEAPADLQELAKGMPGE